MKSFEEPTKKGLATGLANIDELISLSGVDFINATYRTFLLREPDENGFQYYQTRMQTGISKTEIIYQIVRSKEGQSKQVEIPGLSALLARHRLSKLPILGGLVIKKGERLRPYARSGRSKVSCIIPFYNGSQFIDRALKSVARQTVSADEVIVVNDGSKPAEKAYLDSISKKYGVKVIHKENGGQGSARNAGVLASSSEYICFLDQDDFYLPKHNEILLKGIPQDEPDFGWVYGDLREADGDGLTVRTSMVKEHSTHPKQSLVDLIRNDLFVLPSASLINRAAYLSVGGFDEQFTGYEDDDLFLRLFRHGWSNIFIDKPVTVWCIHGASTSYSVKMSRSRFRYLQKLMRNFPDDEVRARYYFRDLMVPRFGGLIISDAVAAKSINSKDKDELLSILRQYYEMVLNAPGMPEEYSTGLTNVVNDILELNA